MKVSVWAVEMPLFVFCGKIILMKKILILGGGFGGIRTALDLSKRLKKQSPPVGGVQITLIDRNSYQIFYPSLYEVASAFGITYDDPYYSKLRGTISVPFSDIFADSGVQIIQGEIEQVDIANKKILTRGREKLDFDYLVMAFGSEVSTYGIPGVNEYTYKFKSVDDALLLFRDIEEIYKSRDRSRLPIKHLIVGAGFTGIELAAELALCTTHIAHKHGINIDKCTSITLLEAGSQMLPTIDDYERIMIRKRLGELGVETMENTVIAEIKDDNNALLKSGQTLNADFIIWTAGVKAPEMLKSIPGLELNPAGRIIVNEYLQISNSKYVFAIGDNIVFNDLKTRKPIPQMAFLAIKQGSIVAKNIARLAASVPSTNLSLYNPSYGTWIAPVGGKHAVVHTKFLVFDGLLGYLFRELIDAKYFFSILPPTKAIRLICARIKIFVKND